jgi:hypothetical protein
MRTIKENIINIEKRYVSFNVTDSKGREVGAKIVLYELDFIEDAHAQGYYDKAAGHYFAFEPHATRDQLRYGACQPGKYFRDSDMRERAINTYLASARKRATRIAMTSAR